MRYINIKNRMLRFVDQHRGIVSMISAGIILVTGVLFPIEFLCIAIFAGLSGGIYLVLGEI